MLAHNNFYENWCKFGKIKCFKHFQYGGCRHLEYIPMIAGLPNVIQFKFHEDLSIFLDLSRFFLYFISLQVNVCSSSYDSAHLCVKRVFQAISMKIYPGVQDGSVKSTTNRSYAG